MAQQPDHSSYDSDPRLPQGLVVLTTLAAVLAAGVYLIVRGLV